MKETISKISLYLIYAGIAVILASPLFVDSSFFFPFITTRAFVFRTVVAFMFLGFLALLATRRDIKLRGGIAAQFLFLFVGIAFVSSLLGPNFYNSFWGDMERSEGLLLWFNLFAFFIIIISVVRSEKNWLRLFDISLVVAVLTAIFGLAQYLGLESVLSSSGTRVDSTFGNPAFYAAYLVFHVAIAAYLSVKRESRILRWYYGISAVLFAWVILATQTRGAALGLAVGLFVTALLIFWRFRSIKIVKKLSLGILVLVIAIVGLVYFARNTAFIRDSVLLQRLASISVTDRTAETRLLTWQGAWDGWKDNFLLGVGMENFNIIFNQKFPPRIYEDEGSVVWFDRAHNFIFDRGTTTGILGLLAYLSFIVYPVYALWKRAKENADTVPLAIVATGLTTAFLIQNLFVFENITTYPILIFTWAFLAFESSKQSDGATPSQSPPSHGGEVRWAYAASIIVFAASIIPLLWVTTWQPAKYNLVAAAGMQERQGKQETFPEFFEKMQEAIEAETYGNPEYRLNFVEHVSLVLGNSGEVLEAAKPYLEYTEVQIDNLIEKNPDDAKNYLLAMRFYNDTRGAVPGQEVERLEKALSFYPKAVELSPTRPHVHQEAGYTYRYLMLGYLRVGDLQVAEEAKANAEKYFTIALELQPQVIVSYTNLIRLHQESGNDVRIQAVVDLMEERDVQYRQPQPLANILAISKSNKSLSWIEYFASELIKIEPENFNAWIDYALALAYQDKKQEAIAAAERITQFGGDFIAQADAFIEQVNSGYYLENPLE